MLVGDIGVRAFDPPSEVRAHEQVEDPVDAVRGDPPAFRLRYGFGDVIGARRLVEARQCVEHRGPHSGPLLALASQPLARGFLERFSLVELVIVVRHDGYAIG